MIAAMRPFNGNGTFVVRLPGPWTWARDADEARAKAQAFFDSQTNPEVITDGLLALLSTD